MLSQFQWNGGWKLWTCFCQACQQLTYSCPLNMPPCSPISAHTSYLSPNRRRQAAFLCQGVMHAIQLRTECTDGAHPCSPTHPQLSWTPSHPHWQLFVGVHNPPMFDSTSSLKSRTWSWSFVNLQPLALCPRHSRFSINICGINELIEQMHWTICSSREFFNYHCYLWGWSLWPRSVIWKCIVFTNRGVAIFKTEKNTWIVDCVFAFNCEMDLRVPKDLILQLLLELKERCKVGNNK